MNSFAVSNGQILGKRKHGSQPIMRVPNQSQNTRGSSSQVFSQNPSATRISINSSTINLQTSEPILQSTPRQTKQNPAGDHTFVTNTVDSMKNNQHGAAKRLKRTSTPSEISSVDSRATTKAISKQRRLRPSNPVKNSGSVYPDVWIGILSAAEPKFVLEARFISKQFKDLLDKFTVIWRDCRLHHYGPDMPDCPISLKEPEYVGLLAGRGCQNSKCPKTETQKVHWIFRVRLCAECLAEKTMRVDELPVLRQHILPATGYEMGHVHGLALWELLPLVRVDGRETHIINIDDQTNTWRTNQGNARQFRFLKSDYTKLEAEYQKLISDNTSAADIRTWTDRKHQETMDLVRESLRIERWSKQHIYQKQSLDAQDLKQERADFFEARALELSPPMSSTMLWKMADFKKILKVRSDPTQRSWDTLKAKIEPYRAHAEHVLEFERQMRSTDQMHHFSAFKKLHDHRNGRKRAQQLYQPEQKYVLRLGQAEFTRCLETGVADEDLLLLCLKRVFDTYSNLKALPTGLNFDGTTGPYRLSLDDARMIIEDVMEQRIPRNSTRGRIVFQSLRCRGCHRNDHVRTYSFSEAFEHILFKHADEVGEGLEYYQFAQSYPKVHDQYGIPGEGRVEFKFPWYSMFWPRSLPLVPRHQDPSKMQAWHPAVPTEYVQLEKPIDRSAFEGRRPCSTGNTDDAFGQNLVYAIQKLYGLDLDSGCQLKIALKFALDLYAKKHVSIPPVSKFVACLDEIRSANPKMDLKFGCGLCVADDKEHKSTRQNKYRKVVDQLEKHWAQKHHGGSVSWTEKMMQLPSESEVRQQITSSEKKLRAEQAATKQRELTRVKDIKKRANAKASVIMQQRVAGEVFDELFPECA